MQPDKRQTRNKTKTEKPLKNQGTKEQQTAFNMVMMRMISSTQTCHTLTHCLVLVLFCMSLLQEVSTARCKSRR